MSNQDLNLGFSPGLDRTLATAAPVTGSSEGRRRRPPLVTREQVVDVAYGLVVTDGPDGLSMRKLAGALHVSLPTVYTAIRSREHLVAQLQNRLIEQIAARLVTEDLALDARGGLPPAQRLASLTGTFLDWANDNPRLAEFLLSEEFSFEVAQRVTTPSADSSESLSYLVGLFRELGRAEALPKVAPVVALTFAVTQVRAVLSLRREPALADMSAERWHALACATLISGLNAIGS
ncbi:MAG: TetR/AcrR family transcriptional regulator [Acidimicrobiales bacterium]